MIEIDQWVCFCVIVGVGSFTCANEEYIIGFFSCQDSMDCDLSVSNVAFQQERLAADHAVH